MATAIADQPSRTERVRGESWVLLILLCVAQFMVIIDATVVNVALPSIGRALRFASPAELQWVVTAYVLVTGGLTLLGGRMADLLDRKRLFIAGLVLFSGASLTTGLAQAPLGLVISRSGQGLGAALLTPSALSIITTSYTGSQRTAALAIWGALGAAGAAVGVVVGGVLTSWFGWQSVFLINVPIGAVAAVLGLFLVPTPPPSTGRMRDLDISGAIPLIAGLVMLVLTSTTATTHGWASAQTLLSAVTAAGLLAGFAVVESNVRQPIIPPSTWRVRSIVSGNAVYLGASAVMGGALFLSTLYLQRVLGLPAWQAGLAFLPLALAVGVGGKVASRLVGHAGSRAVLLLGLAVEGGGALLLARVPGHATYLADVLPGFVAIGFGLGFSFVAAPLTVMDKVSGEQSGMVSGLMQTAHEIGISLGVAFTRPSTSLKGLTSDLFPAASFNEAGPVIAFSVVALVVVVATRGQLGFVRPQSKAVVATDQ